MTDGILGGEPLLNPRESVKLTEILRAQDQVVATDVAEAASILRQVREMLCNPKYPRGVIGTDLLSELMFIHTIVKDASSTAGAWMAEDYPFGVAKVPDPVGLTIIEILESEENVEKFGGVLLAARLLEDAELWLEVESLRRVYPECEVLWNQLTRPRPVAEIPATRVFSLKCDGEWCWRRSPEKISPEEAIEAATKEGWFVSDDKDYCPEHAPGREGVRLDLDVIDSLIFGGDE